MAEACQFGLSLQPSALALQLLIFSNYSALSTTSSTTMQYQVKIINAKTQRHKENRKKATKVFGVKQ